MIEKPNFYEGEILYDALYEIDKSMAEKIKEYSLNIQDFKEYIEMILDDYEKGRIKTTEETLETIKDFIDEDKD